MYKNIKSLQSKQNFTLNFIYLKLIIIKKGKNVIN